MLRLQVALGRYALSETALLEHQDRWVKDGTVWGDVSLRSLGNVLQAPCNQAGRRVSTSARFT